MAAITDRIDNITRIPAAYQKAELPAPKSVKIEISPRCNYRCGFCALRTREVQPKWDMDFGLFKRVTREMREAGVEEIGVFYLGESFMNPRLLVDCIRYLKRALGDTKAERDRVMPVNHADKVKIPVYLAAGARDPRCPPENTERMYKALVNAGNPPEGMIIQSGEMHGFYKEENNLKLYTEMLNFFDRHIGPKKVAQGG